MLGEPRWGKITTAALAAKLDVSEAALYRHFASKAQMYEGLIEFIESTIFGLVNQISAEQPLEKEGSGLKQAYAITAMLLKFAEQNRGMTRVLIGDALVGEHERLQERINSLYDRIELALKQALRIAVTQGAYPADFDHFGRNIRFPGAKLRILMSDGGHEAILKLENSMWRSATITDLGFQCQERSGATYGLMFYGTAFSGHTVRNVVVRNSSVGYGIVQSTGGNGEFTLYDNCFAFDVDKFFYSNAGQAYVQHFNHCVCTLNSGGIYFHLDLQSGGGGIDVFDFNATGASRPGGAPSDTTLFKNTASNSCLNFIGGRVEGLTQLYESRGGSPNLFVTAKFEGMQFSIDSKPGELGKRFVEVAVTPDVLTIQSCAFYGIRGNEAIEVQVRESYAYVIFQQCTFFELSKPPTVVAD